MTADFSGRSVRLPPGIQEPPSYVREVPKPCWVSSVAHAAALDLGEPGQHVVTGGRTLWLDQTNRPASVVVSHPNRLGASEDLEALVELARRWDIQVWVDVDPYLLPLVDLPAPLHGLVRWDNAGPSLERVAARCRLAAHSFRRRVAQIPRLKFVSESQAGRAVSFVTPVPAQQVVQQLEATGALVDSLPLWEEVVVVWLGWWHTRRQIEQLASALGTAVEGTRTITGISSASIDDDLVGRLPDDLPRRRLDTI